jgi:hypothetical protein
MRVQPAATEIRYTFRAANENGGFQQFPLLSADAFERAAKRRDAQLSVGSSLLENLELLDKAGAFQPVLFELEDGVHIYREEQGYQPWTSYAYSDYDDLPPKARPYFAYWQLLYIYEAIDLGRAPVSLDWLLDSDRHLGEGFAIFYGAQREVWRTLDGRWRAVVLLAVRLQNRYGPKIKGSLTRSTSTQVYDAATGRMVDPYVEEARRFDPERVLDELGLTVDEVANLHQRVAGYGTVTDPNEHFHTLLRMTRASDRDKLAGAARRAQDAFDVADLIRGFYYQLTGELLLRPDEIFDGSDKSWKKRIFGRWPILAFTRADLQAELRRHDLWPHQVHLIVEGETEEIICRYLLEEISGAKPEEIGISFAKIHDIGLTRLRQEIVRAKGHSRWAVLVVDSENDIDKEVELLKRDGVLSEETCWLSSSFEEANFSDAELVSIVQGLASEASVSVEISPQEFRRLYNDHRENCVGKQRPKGAMTFLLGRAHAQTAGALGLSKKTIAERRMGELLLRDLEERGEEAMEARPILKTLVSILRVA